VIPGRDAADGEEKQLGGGPVCEMNATVFSTENGGCNRRENFQMPVRAYLRWEGEGRTLPEASGQIGVTGHPRGLLELHSGKGSRRGWESELNKRGAAVLQGAFIYRN